MVLPKRLSSVIISTEVAPYPPIKLFCAEPHILTDEKRARLILMLAEGRSYAEIQQQLSTTAPYYLAMEATLYRERNFWSDEGQVPCSENASMTYRNEPFMSLDVTLSQQGRSTAGRRARRNHDGIVAVDGSRCLMPH